MRIFLVILAALALTGTAQAADCSSEPYGGGSPAYLDVVSNRVGAPVWGAPRMDSQATGYGGITVMAYTCDPYGNGPGVYVALPDELNDVILGKPLPTGHDLYQRALAVRILAHELGHYHGNYEEWKAERWADRHFFEVSEQLGASWFDALGLSVVYTLGHDVSPNFWS